MDTNNTNKDIIWANVNFSEITINNSCQIKSYT